MARGGARIHPWAAQGRQRAWGRGRRRRRRDGVVGARGRGNSSPSIKNGFAGCRRHDYLPYFVPLPSVITSLGRAPGRRRCGGALDALLACCWPLGRLSYRTALSHRTVLSCLGPFPELGPRRGGDPSATAWGSVAFAPAVRSTRGRGEKRD